MIWRLEKERHLGSSDTATDVRAAFQERGSLVTGGRRHRRGTPVAYASEHPAVRSTQWEHAPAGPQGTTAQESSSRAR